MDLDRVEAAIRTYHAVSTERIGRRPLSGTKLELERSAALNALNHLGGLMQQELPGQARDGIRELERIFHDLCYKPAADVLHELLRPVESLARMLNKVNPRIIVEDPGFGLNQEGYELLSSIFIHLIRNSMDHGIEAPEERRVKGKDRHGTLRISLTEADDQLLIFYSDDGAGLDLDKLKEIGLARGIFRDDGSLTPQRISSLIFDSGISTSSKVTEISGRGVGMDAVRKYLERAGGSIALVLRESKTRELGRMPFEFHIRIPRIFWAPPLQALNLGKTA